MNRSITSCCICTRDSVHSVSVIVVTAAFGLTFWTAVQLTAVDGRRALVTLPNDPDLVDILAQNGVDISVSEGEQQGSLVSLLGNLLFPLLAFGGLFFLFRRAGSGGQGGGLGGPMGPMDFGKNKAKFQEDPETGITFDDVAVSVKVCF